VLLTGDSSPDIGVSIAEIVSDLKSWKDSEDPFFAYADVIKTSATNFRKHVIEALNTTTFPSTVLGQLYPAFASQIPEDGEEDVTPSLLSLANGGSGKKLLRDVAQLIAQLDPQTALDELTGKGESKATKSLRWHPDEYRPAALRAFDPGGAVPGDSIRSLPILNVLAFFGLCAHPVADAQPKPKTTGFVTKGRDGFFRWPIWNYPLSCSATRAIIQHPAIFAPEPDNSVVSRLGVTSVWQSERFSKDKSLYFSPATPVL